MPNTAVLASTKPGVRSQSENRRIKINYPGSGNNSAFVYDALGQTVSIAEMTSGSLSSIRLFCWVLDDRCELRNSAGGISAQYFSQGEASSGTKYFYTNDHLGLTVGSVSPFGPLSLHDRYSQTFNPFSHAGSIREMTDIAGTIKEQLIYDAFGRVQHVQASLVSDFQYAGYYNHAPSGLNLTRTRFYNANLGRWINRDPDSEENIWWTHQLPQMQESFDYHKLAILPRVRQAGQLRFEQYVYTANNPIKLTDPSGLRPCRGWGDDAFWCASACAAGCFNKPNEISCFQQCYLHCMGW